MRKESGLVNEAELTTQMTNLDIGLLISIRNVCFDEDSARRREEE